MVMAHLVEMEGIIADQDPGCCVSWYIVSSELVMRQART
jgi:hypothetical protein